MPESTEYLRGRICHAHEDLLEIHSSNGFCKTRPFRTLISQPFQLQNLTKEDSPGKLMHITLVEQEVSISVCY